MQNIRYVTSIACLVCCACFIDQVKGQSVWKVLKEKNGIRISHRPSTRSAFDDLRVEADLPGTPNLLLSTLLDVSHYPDWAYGSAHCMAVEKVKDSGLLYYSEIKVPWPAEDRDLYAQITVLREAGRNWVRVICSGLPHFRANRAGFVRIPFSRGTWIISPLSEKVIHVDYVLEADPGGSVPGWIMNLFSAKGPYETFIRLRQRLYVATEP